LKETPFQGVYCYDFQAESFEFPFFGAGCFV